LDQIRSIEPWLNHFTPSTLGVGAQAILKHIHEAQKTNNLIVVSTLVERLLNLTNRVERAECQVACALVLYEMNDPWRAFELLDQARFSFTDDYHKQGVVLWMMGIVLRQIPSRQEDVMACWMTAINIFKSIQETRFHATKHKEPLWHGEQIPQMEETLQKLIEGELVCLPPECPTQVEDIQIDP
jgi:hypothetical protein